MSAKEIYEKETGNKAPDNQFAHHNWYIKHKEWQESYNKYVEWLEKIVENLYRITEE